MKAMVTGGTGFVGSHLVDRLLASGHDVTALVRSPAKAAGLEARGVRLVKGDLHDEAAIRDAVRGQNVVYHVAALVAAKDEAEFFRANRDGTANIVRAMEQLAPYARLVHVSSLAAAGPAALGVPRTADQPEAPVTMYGRSKHAAEQVVRQSHLPWVIARPPAVYGPRDSDNFLQVFKLVRSGLAPLFGDGSQELSMVYAPDLARSLELIGSTPGIEGRSYFTNHPEIVTTRDLVGRIGKLMGRERAHHSHSPARGESAARRRGPGGRTPRQPDDPPGRQGARFLLARLDGRSHAADVRDGMDAGARPRPWPRGHQGVVPGLRLASPLVPPPESGAPRWRAAEIFLATYAAIVTSPPSPAST